MKAYVPPTSLSAILDNNNNIASNDTTCGLIVAIANYCEAPWQSIESPMDLSIVVKLQSLNVCLLFVLMTFFDMTTLYPLFLSEAFRLS